MIYMLFIFSLAHFLQYFSSVFCYISIISYILWIVTLRLLFLRTEVILTSTLFKLLLLFSFDSEKKKTIVLTKILRISSVNGFVLSLVIVHIVVILSYCYITVT